ALSNGCSFFGRAQALLHGPDTLSAPAAISLPTSLVGPGGAIFNSGSLAVDSSDFISNTATVTGTGGGGAIENFSGWALTVTNSSFSHNTAWQDGGAVFNAPTASAFIAGSTFSHNGVLTDSGGAIANLGALTVTDGIFTQNGGAPYQGNIGYGGG